MEKIISKSEMAEHIRRRLERGEPFCTLPWTKIWIEDGTMVKNCCYQVGAVGDLSKYTFDEIWNGEVQIAVRQHILEGRFHPFCRCHEKVGSIPNHFDPAEIEKAQDMEVPWFAQDRTFMQRVIGKIRRTIFHKVEK